MWKAGTTFRKGVVLGNFVVLVKDRRGSRGGAIHPGSRTMKSSGPEPAERLTSTSRLSQIWIYALSDGVPRRSLVALIVGAILNLINQGDALFGEGHLNLTKMILSFAVLYCVATYGAVACRMSGAWSGSVSQVASRSADSRSAERSQHQWSEERPSNVFHQVFAFLVSARAGCGRPRIEEGAADYRDEQDAYNNEQGVH